MQTLTITVSDEIIDAFCKQNDYNPKVLNADGKPMSQLDFLQDQLTALISQPYITQKGDEAADLARKQAIESASQDAASSVSIS